MASTIVSADGPRLAKRLSMDMETGETIEHTAENTAPAAPPGVQKKVSSAPLAARGASKPLLAAVAFIAVVAICGCAIAVVALAKADAAMTQATGDVTMQTFAAQKARQQYEAGAQRIIGHATNNLDMHPACGQSEANRQVRREERREEEQRESRRELGGGS